MKPIDLFVHDSKLESVYEDCESDELVFNINWPKDWENNIFTKAKIVFENIINYEVHEGPFSGCPTILDVTESDSIYNDVLNRKKYQLTTTAGIRTLSSSGFKFIETIKRN